MNVLIVDDEYLELEQLFQLIYARYPNWKVFPAENSREAMKIAHEHPIQLALLDIHLNGVSGLDLAEQLKSLSSEIGIVIVTAYQNFDYAKRAIKLNAIDYIVKPIIEKELYNVLDPYEKKEKSTQTIKPIMKKVLNYLQAHYYENIHLQDVARYVHVSPNYLSKKFNDELHLSYNDYLAHVRINRAKQLMVEHPEYSLQFISDKVGFSSQNYFTHSFKKIEKMTPTQYKNEKIEDPHE